MSVATLIIQHPWDRPRTSGINQRACMELYDRYGAALIRKAERLLSNREDAEDIVQGLFVDLWQKGHADHDLAYLYRAINNRCLNFVRDRDNRRQLLARQQDALRGPTRLRCDDRAISLDLLVKLAEQLDVKTLEVLAFRYFDDMTQEEIAALTRTSRRTVGKRLAKIRAAVQALNAEPEAEQ